MYSEYLLAKRVCSVSNSEKRTNEGLMYDMAHPFGSCCLVRNDLLITTKTSMDAAIVASVSSEIDHGFLKRHRRLLLLSAIFSGSASSVRSFKAKFSLAPGKGDVVFQACDFSATTLVADS